MDQFWSQVKGVFCPGVPGLFMSEALGLERLALSLFSWGGFLLIVVARG